MNLYVALLLLVLTNAAITTNEETSSDPEQSQENNSDLEGSDGGSSEGLSNSSLELSSSYNLKDRLQLLDLNSDQLEALGQWCGYAKACLLYALGDDEYGQYALRQLASFCEFSPITGTEAESSTGRLQASFSDKLYDQINRMDGHSIASLLADFYMLSVSPESFTSDLVERCGDALGKWMFEDAVCRSVHSAPVLSSDFLDPPPKDLLRLEFKPADETPSGDEIVLETDTMSDDSSADCGFPAHSLDDDQLIKCASPKCLELALEQPVSSAKDRHFLEDALLNLKIDTNIIRDLKKAAAIRYFPGEVSAFVLSQRQQLLMRPTMWSLLQESVARIFEIVSSEHSVFADQLAELVLFEHLSLASRLESLNFEQEYDMHRFRSLLLLWAIFSTFDPVYMQDIENRSFFCLMDIITDPRMVPVCQDTDFLNLIFPHLLYMALYSGPDSLSSAVDLVSLLSSRVTPVESSLLDHLQNICKFLGMAVFDSIDNWTQLGAIDFNSLVFTDMFAGLNHDDMLQMTQSIVLFICHVVDDSQSHLYDRFLSELGRFCNSREYLEDVIDCVLNTGWDLSCYHTTLISLLIVQECLEEFSEEMPVVEAVKQMIMSTPEICSAHVPCHRYPLMSFLSKFSSSTLLVICPQLFSSSVGLAIYNELIECLAEDQKLAFRLGFVPAVSPYEWTVANSDAIISEIASQGCEAVCTSWFGKTSSPDLQDYKLAVIWRAWCSQTIIELPLEDVRALLDLHQSEQNDRILIFGRHSTVKNRDYCRLLLYAIVHTEIPVQDLDHSFVDLSDSQVFIDLFQERLAGDLDRTRDQQIRLEEFLSEMLFSIIQLDPYLAASVVCADSYNFAKWHEIVIALLNMMSASHFPEDEFDGNSASLFEDEYGPTGNQSDLVRRLQTFCQHLNQVDRIDKFRNVVLWMQIILLDPSSVKLFDEWDFVEWSLSNMDEEVLQCYGARLAAVIAEVPVGVYAYRTVFDARWLSRYLRVLCHVDPTSHEVYDDFMHHIIGHMDPRDVQTSIPSLIPYSHGALDCLSRALVLIYYHGPINVQTVHLHRRIILVSLHQTYFKDPQCDLHSHLLTMARLVQLDTSAPTVHFAQTQSAVESVPEALRAFYLAIQLLEESKRNSSLVARFSFLPIVFDIIRRMSPLDFKLSFNGRTVLTSLLHQSLDFTNQVHRDMVQLAAYNSDTAMDLKDDGHTAFCLLWKHLLSSTNSIHDTFIDIFFLIRSLDPDEFDSKLFMYIMQWSIAPDSWFNSQTLHVVFRLVEQSETCYQVPTSADSSCCFLVAILRMPLNLSDEYHCRFLTIATESAARNGGFHGCHNEDTVLSLLVQRYTNCSPDEARFLESLFTIIQKSYPNFREEFAQLEATLIDSSDDIASNSDPEHQTRACSSLSTLNDRTPKNIPFIVSSESFPQAQCPLSPIPALDDVNNSVSFPDGISYSGSQSGPTTSQFSDESDPVSGLALSPSDLSVGEAPGAPVLKSMHPSCTQCRLPEHASTSECHDHSSVLSEPVLPKPTVCDIISEMSNEPSDTSVHPSSPESVLSLHPNLDDNSATDRSDLPKSTKCKFIPEKSTTSQKSPFNASVSPSSSERFNLDSNSSPDRSDYLWIGCAAFSAAVAIILLLFIIRNLRSNRGYGLRTAVAMLDR